MIKDNQRHFNRLHVVLDAMVTASAYLLAWWLKFKSGILSAQAGVLPMEIYMGALVVIIPLFILLYYAFNLYTPKRVQGRRLEAWNIFKANTVGLVIIFSILFLLDRGRGRHFAVRSSAVLGAGFLLVACVWKYVSRGATGPQDYTVTSGYVWILCGAAALLLILQIRRIGRKETDRWSCA